MGLSDEPRADAAERDPAAGLPQAAGLDLGAEEEARAGRKGDGIAACGRAGAIKAAGQRDAGEAEIAEGFAGAASLSALESGDTAIEYRAGE
ncbi:hypothetical protein GCM10022211_08090 [Sphingomonas humi]|uniref:Uncharacterized protein n=1 Tax=Sphingomonas humi TaxID=335630 RepID=A0ABP7RP46_9SPHN